MELTFLSESSNTHLTLRKLKSFKKKKVLILKKSNPISKGTMVLAHHSYLNPNWHLALWELQAFQFDTIWLIFQIMNSLHMESETLVRLDLQSWLSDGDDFLGEPTIHRRFGCI